MAKKIIQELTASATRPTPTEPPAPPAPQTAPAEPTRPLSTGPLGGEIKPSRFFSRTTKGIL